MTTDDERRIIARKLRDIDAERLDRVYGMDGESGTCEDPWMSQAGRGLMLGAIAEAVGLRFTKEVRAAFLLISRASQRARARSCYIGCNMLAARFGACSMWQSHPAWVRE